ncbi:hypothetical protein TR51_00295 [Kitasatospora griseola]|uniref:Uncharacterized protein n=1 Tax=Kitasatospora griseola TaxID=2064 RepID=A0A0D0Q0Z6_KITGR|nr:hypothetical protein [Kitasatospora griseola]KIQ66177.1 hypothetical protein TR51_00295 [Kitasatospora griseola]
MRAVKRVLALGALTAPLVIGCAGLASADDFDAHFDKSQFIANESGAGFANTGSFVDENGVEHHAFWIWADDNGVSGSFLDSGAHF